MGNSYPNERTNHVFDYYNLDQRGMSWLDVMEDLQYLIHEIRPLVDAEVKEHAKKNGVVN